MWVNISGDLHIPCIWHWCHFSTEGQWTAPHWCVIKATSLMGELKAESVERRSAYLPVYSHRHAANQAFVAALSSWPWQQGKQLISPVFSRRQTELEHPRLAQHGGLSIRSPFTRSVNNNSILSEQPKFAQQLTAADNRGGVREERRRSILLQG